MSWVLDTSDDGCGHFSGQQGDSLVSGMSEDLGQELILQEDSRYLYSGIREPGESRKPHWEFQHVVVSVRGCRGRGLSWKDGPQSQDKCLDFLWQVRGREDSQHFGIWEGRDGALQGLGWK